MPAGRPSKYDPAYCDAVKAFMGDGYSIAATAGMLKVSRQTIYQWAEDHPEFSDALNEGRTLAAIWWEQKAREIAIGGEGNATMVIFGLKNRVADEWRDKQQTELSGPDGGALPMSLTIRNVIARADD